MVAASQFRSRERRKAAREQDGFAFLDDVLSMVGGLANGEVTQMWSEEEVRAALRAGLNAGEAPASISKRLAKESGWERRKIYLMVIDA